jgi:hypothetical protein
MRVDSEDIAKLMQVHFSKKFINKDEIILLHPDKETVWKVVVQAADSMKDKNRNLKYGKIVPET